MIILAKQVIIALKKYAKPARAKLVARFFKTGPGQYGEGDVFWGLSVPEVRTVAKKFAGLPLPEVEKLLKNPVHEVRLTALIILVKQFPQNSEKVFNLYIKNTRFINNWDLVDLSAPQIVGGYLCCQSEFASPSAAAEGAGGGPAFNCHPERSEGSGSPIRFLTTLARSKNLWEKRIAVLATFYFIKQGRSAEALKIAKLLLSDKHDLIHKAVGWMLREVGKNCPPNVLLKFLKQNYSNLSRTTLRYAIERYPRKMRKEMLRGKF